MERREAYHDNPNVPPWHRSLTLLEMRREDTEEERRRSSAGRRPGRARGHPDTMSKLDAGAERGRTCIPAPQCAPSAAGPACCTAGGACPRRPSRSRLQKRKVFVFHDLVCNGCGHVAGLLGAAPCLARSSAPRGWPSSDPSSSTAA